MKCEFELKEVVAKKKKSIFWKGEGTKKHYSIDFGTSAVLLL